MPVSDAINKLEFGQEHGFPEGQVQSEFGAMPKWRKSSRKAISQRMRLLRRATGLNQTDFATEIGVTRNVWENVEGEFGRIGLDTALKLCDRYEVSLDWIYRGLDDMMPHGLAIWLGQAKEAES